MRLETTKPAAAFPPVPQRAKQRRKVTLRALTQTEVASDERLGVVTDLSETGAFIEMRGRPAKGSRFFMSMFLGDGRTLHTYVEVMRVTSRGVGARFVRLDPDAAEHLRAATKNP